MAHRKLTKIKTQQACHCIYRDGTSTFSKAYHLKDSLHFHAEKTNQEKEALEVQKRPPTNKILESVHNGIKKKLPGTVKAPLEIRRNWVKNIGSRMLGQDYWVKNSGSRILG